MTPKGQLWAWGRNEDGQLGAQLNPDGSLSKSTAPQRVAGLMGVPVRLIACGEPSPVES